ncbi:hypothetical protein HELRODRAFT_165769 [Helobdella robusta]|uniref:Uncharacterized protein n=1 Tax=Helobdella robusta TaxID=6412 RepID=T1EX98_HELRO|nr:hypothetical protein HELRODRAFT_165769 [Helobdella robusta]ESN91708.1 hypothetical protein HELRODRAFT_165769 [Helobdella robusta]
MNDQKKRKKKLLCGESGEVVLSLSCESVKEAEDENVDCSRSPLTINVASNSSAELNGHVVCEEANGAVTQAEEQLSNGMVNDRLATFKPSLHSNSDGCIISPDSCEKTDLCSQLKTFDQRNNSKSFW